MISARAAVKAAEYVPIIVVPNNGYHIEYGRTYRAFPTIRRQITAIVNSFIFKVRS